MLNRIIRIAATTLGALLLAGCLRTSYDPAPSKGISFSAGPALLQDGATKTGTLKTGNTFSTGDAFLAWAWHNAAHQHFSFGTTTPVTLGNNGLWDYAPHQYWNWREGEDYYDFLAVYPANADIVHSAATLANPNLKATVTYVPTTPPQYDLMVAGLRRTDKSVEPVPLTFSHALSAVSVEVKNAEGSNEGGSPLTITLVSAKFLNLIASSSITVTFDGTNLSYTRSGDRNTTSAVLGPEVPANTQVAPGYGFPSQNIITRLTSWLQSNTSLANPEALAEAVYEDEVWTMSAADRQDWITGENTGLSEDEINALLGQIYAEDLWDLMIPQDLSPNDNLPALEIIYHKGDPNTVFRETLPLNEIRNQATNQPITVWNPGIKYHYEIELRIGVGIVVTVTTTPWEVVEAETPGLMI